jgi:3',5'-cyclic AMP phosphodiesterase CpdA
VSRIVQLALSLCVAAGSLSAADLYFLQMSDPQFGMYSADQDFVHETANFEFAIANANRLKPAFVVVCGDLVNKAGDVKQIAQYLRVAAKLDKSIKLYNVAGNHDVGNTPSPESLAAYRERFGPDYYTFRSADLAGFVLDSSLIQHPENAPQEAARQEQWLRAELEKAATDGVHWRVVFQHIPWFLENADEPDQYFNIPKEARSKYLAMLQKYGVAATFAGHYHRNASGQAGSMRMITTGPVGMPLGDATSGIRVVKVTPASIEDKYYSLGNIPNTLIPPAAQQAPAIRVHLRPSAASYNVGGGTPDDSPGPPVGRQRNQPVARR